MTLHARGKTCVIITEVKFQTEKRQNKIKMKRIKWLTKVLRCMPAIPGGVMIV
jgi:hypothetical protein